MHLHAVPMSSNKYIHFRMHVFVSILTKTRTWNRCHVHPPFNRNHYNDVIVSAMASQITNFMIVYLTLYSGAGKRKHQSVASLAFVRGVHRWPVNSPYKGPVTRKLFPFDDVIMFFSNIKASTLFCLADAKWRIALSGLALPWVAKMKPFPYMLLTVSNNNYNCFGQCPGRVLPW